MSDYPTHLQSQVMLIPLDTLAQHAVVSTVSDITDPKHKRFETFNNTNTTSDYKQNQTIHVATTVLRIIAEGLNKSGWTYFDSKLFADPYNSAMVSAYKTARAECPNDLDAALERAWVIRRHDWEKKASVVVPHVRLESEITSDLTDEASHEPEVAKELADDQKSGGLFARAKAKIDSLMTRAKNDR